jgi:integrase/recombinase XerC
MTSQAALIAEYRAFLSDNRRLSVHSVRAYVATAERLTDFLSVHLGEAIDRKALPNITAAHLRSFLADRRGDGLANRSTARELSAIRNFLRFALGDEATLPVLKGPRTQRSLPRPVNPDDVMALADDISHGAADSWIGARDWAVLLLLYGCGLRISEATGLTGDVLPLGGTLRVTGKRNKTRIVPLLEQVKSAIEDYISLCPYPPERDQPLFRGSRGGAIVARPHQAGRPRCAYAPRVVRTNHPSRATPQLRNTFIGGWSGFKEPARITRPCQLVLDAGLYRSRYRYAARRICQFASAGSIASGRGFQRTSRQT